MPFVDKHPTIQYVLNVLIMVCFDGFGDFRFLGQKMLSV